ncbi:MAG: prephenate dehydrogenase [Clostridiales bacterium]|jgi:prephenate dehydrogenase|nr:prephenate dehydrogenase [Clostridiales bacterium]
MDISDFKRVAVLGMGLMGGSFAAAAKKKIPSVSVIGFDQNPETRKRALEIGAADYMAETPEEAVSAADLTVLAVPIGGFEALFKQIAPHLKPGAIVFDLGSVKGCVTEMSERLLPESVQFLGGHPMTGSEKAGIEAATATLYENAYFFLTPNATTHNDTIEIMIGFVQQLGAFPILIAPGEHDKIAARISHIPHLAAVLLVEMVQESDYASFAGGGFRDTTRIASGNPAMWRDIFMYNRKEMIKGIDLLEERLKAMRSRLIQEDPYAIESALSEAKRMRDDMPFSGSDYMPPLYDIIIDVEDKPGILGELTTLLGEEGINIKEIEILHARESEGGAVRIGLKTKEEQTTALKALEAHHFKQKKK